MVDLIRCVAVAQGEMDQAEWEEGALAVGQEAGVRDAQRRWCCGRHIGG